MTNPSQRIKQTQALSPGSSLSEAEGDESPPFRLFIECLALTATFLFSLARLSAASHRATIWRGDKHWRLVDPSLRRRQSMPKSTTQSSSSSSSAASMSATRMRWFLEKTRIGFWPFWEGDLKKRPCFIWGLGSVSGTACWRGDWVGNWMRWEGFWIAKKNEDLEGKGFL